MSESESASTTNSTNYRLPSGTTLQHCAKLGIVEDKPISFEVFSDELFEMEQQAREISSWEKMFM